MTNNKFDLLPIELMEDIFLLSLESSTRKYSVSELIKLRLVCKNWKQMIDSDEGLWRILCLKPSEVQPKSRSIFSLTLAKLSMDDDSIDLDEQIESQKYLQQEKSISKNLICFRPGKIQSSSVEKEFHNLLYDKISDICVSPKKFYQNLYCCTSHFRFEEFELIMEGVEQSSFDHVDQTISETLKDSDSYWSSKGSDDADSLEFLTYKLKYEVSVVTHVAILPYKAVYMRNMPVFSPKGICISVGFSKSQMHFQTRVFPVENVSELQIFEISPVVVIGNHIRIDLVGKHSTQRSDDRYYSVLQRVQCFGIPIAAISSCGWGNLSYSLFNWATKIQDYMPKINPLVPVTETYSFDEVLNQSLSKWSQDLVPFLILKASKNDFLNIIRKLILQGRWDLAASKLARTEIDEGFRTEQTISWFQNPMNIFLNPSEIKQSQNSSSSKACKYYIKALVSERTNLTQWESLELVKQAVESDQFVEVSTAILHERLHCSESLGDYLHQYHPQLAEWVYLNALCFDKFLRSILAQDKFIEALRVNDHNLFMSSDELFAEVLQGSHTRTLISFQFPFRTPQAYSIDALLRGHRFALALLQENNQGVWFEKVLSEGSQSNPMRLRQSSLTEDEITSSTSALSRSNETDLDEIILCKMKQILGEEVFREVERPSEIQASVQRNLRLNESEMNLDTKIIKDTLSPLINKMQIKANEEERKEAWEKISKKINYNIKLSIAIQSRISFIEMY